MRPVWGSSARYRRRVARGDFDPESAYRLMLRMRLVDQTLVEAWHDGFVPGEYHSGIGEEGINAGVLLHLSGRDTMALDHRNTAPLIGRGADPRSLMLEVLGSELGMNHGHAGHMHLLEPDLHAGADGIVGASGPLAVGHAIANQQLHPGRVAIAFHGEAAMNAGLLMESYNMAVAWKLPVLFVCKDNKWSITTYSKDVTGGDVVDRARSFGLATETVRGERVGEVYAAAGRLIHRARSGGGPGFLFATCHRPGGHFEGDPVLRLLRNPGSQAKVWGPGLVAGVRADGGGTARERAGAVIELGARGARAARDWTVRRGMDPLPRGRDLVDPEVADDIDAEVAAEVVTAVAEVRAAVGARPTFGSAGWGAR